MVLISTLSMLAALGQQTLGKNIYAQAVAKLETVHSVEGKLEVQSEGKVQTMTFRVSRPNFFDVRSPDLEEHSDGKTYWNFSPKQNTWIRNEAQGLAPDSLPFFNELIAPQYQGMGIAKEGKFDGRDVWEVPTSLYHLLIFDKSTLAPIGYRSADGEEPSVTARFKDLKFNVTLPESSFSWTPPAGSKEYMDPALEKLLKVGTQAPDFSLRSGSEPSLNSKDLLKQSKGLLLNFWFISCPPCMEELPVLTRLYPQIKAAGVEVVAINIRDSDAKAQQFWRDKGYPFRSFLPGDDKMIEAFGVSFAPTNYLLDSSGRIVAVIPGFDEAQLIEELGRLGVSIKE
jgi:peroxiredoxin/outer membrane lipoprotein-sorting protein